jgi:exodeoxyribonuclease III
MFSILSWNILQGGGSRLTSLINEINILRPQVCVFSEFRNNDTGHQLRIHLMKLGYRFQGVTNAIKDDNSVIIASTLPCDFELHSKSDPEFGGNIISAHFEAFSILGVYLPHKKKHILFDFIIELVQNSAKSYIITGDFNSGKNGIDQVGSSFWYEDKLVYLENNEYVDAFRNIHGNVKEYSWYSHQGNGYRYDHTYIHENLCPILKSCDYLHSLREQKMSDHSPMLITFG